jgi:hypothetical protein
MSFDILGLGTGPAHPALSNNPVPIISNQSNQSNNTKKASSVSPASDADSNEDDGTPNPQPLKTPKSKSKQQRKKSLREDLQELEIASEEELSEPSSEGSEGSGSGLDDVEFIDLPSEEDEKEFEPGSANFKKSRHNFFDRYTWTEKQLLLREYEYTEEKSLTFYMASYNVNGKKLANENVDLSSWLLHDLNHNPKIADVYAIGFQEIVDLNAQSLFVDHNASQPWERVIQHTLNSTGKKFVQVASVHLVGLSLCVYIKEKYQPFVSDVRTSTVGVGIMGVGGNKGAAVVRFNVYKSAICIVNTHLAAHQKNYKARNSDYHNILRKCVLHPRSTEGLLARKYLDTTNRVKMQRTHVQLVAEGEREEEDEISSNLKPSASNPSVSSAKKGNDLDNFKNIMSAGFKTFTSKLNTMANQLDLSSIGINKSLASSGSEEDSVDDSSALTIYDADHIFWIGDLNYRLDVVELGMETTHQLIQTKSFKQLLQHDQLLQQKKEHNAFVGFLEGKINFPPTYKYITGTDQYDRREDKKVRYPAYTDRIQWCSNNEENLHLNFYTRAAELKLSDHKPIMASFVVPLKKEIEKKKAKIKAALDKLSDQQCQPRAQFNCKYIDLGDLRFDIPITRKITVRNQGNSVIQFKLESLLQESEEKLNGSGEKPAVKQPFHPWLSVVPTEGEIQLEEHITLTLTVLVDRKIAHSLNNESKSFDPLLLRMAGGKQYCIPFTGRYMKSTLGAELKFLTNLQGKAIRSLTRSELSAVTSGNKSSSNNVPHELFRLIDHINGLAGLKAKNCWTIHPAYAIKGKTKQFTDYSKLLPSAQVRYLVECLDTGRPFDNIPDANSQNSNNSTAKQSSSPLDIDLTKTKIKLPVQFFVQTLLYWLHSLQSPIFYKGIWRQENFQAQNAASSGAAAEAASYYDGLDLTAWCYQATLELSPEFYHTFIYTMSLLKAVIKDNKENGASVEQIAAIWASPLTHLHPDKPFSSSIPLTPVQIIKHFLISPDFI